MREVFQGRTPDLPFAISTFDILKRRTVAFTEGALPLLIRASCAVPLMFHPVKIKGRYYWDGGTVDKAAITSVAPDERALVHYLPSRGIHSACEGRRPLMDPDRTHFVIAPNDLAPVGPFHLKNGLANINRAYEYAMTVLNRDLTSASVDCSI